MKKKKRSLGRRKNTFEKKKRVLSGHPSSKLSQPVYFGPIIGSNFEWNRLSLAPKSPEFWVDQPGRSGLIIIVVTHFWTPRAEDGVYPFWTKCRSVAHIWWKIDKSGGERNIFFRTLFELFSTFFYAPLYCQKRQVS